MCLIAGTRICKLIKTSAAVILMFRDAMCYLFIYLFIYLSIYLFIYYAEATKTQENDISTVK